MRRRDLFALLAAIVAAWPLAAAAQQRRIPVVGFLGISLPFVQFMESLYVEGIDLTREPDLGRDVAL